MVASLFALLTTTGFASDVFGKTDVTLVVDGKTEQIRTYADTVADVLDEKGIEIQSTDKVTPTMSSKTNDQMKIEVENSFPVTIQVDGKKEEVWSTSTTVANFLENQQVTLNKLDYIEPSMNETITASSTVKITRVEKVSDVVEEPIDFKTVKQADKTLAKGKQKVIQVGVKGVIQKMYERTLEDGKEVSRKTIITETLKQSKNHIIAVGTKVAEKKPAVAKEITVTATAYVLNCKGCSGRTATGLVLRPNMKIVAVDPSVIPLGTKLYVEGYGYALAADKGGWVKGKKVDLLFPSESSARNWGVRKIKVKILK